MTTNNTDNSRSNEPTAFQQALEAGRAWTRAGENNAKGDALAIVALCHVWNDFEFTYTVERANDEKDEPRTIKLAQMFEEIKSENGSNDTRAINARFNTLSRVLFGISEPTNAQAQSIRRSLLSARYLIQQGASVSLKGSKLVVPYSSVTPAPKADATDNDKAVFEAMKDKPFVLDGKKGASLSELRNRAAAAFPTKKRPAKAKVEASREESMAASIAFLNTCLEHINDPNASEADVALSSARRVELFKLANQIAAYFSADPMDEGEGTDTEEKKAA
ncbi:MAG TPA: hypothetical protein VLG09_03825 [Candidatus Saccharimonadales bacterium]|nr:hypothetical protein [Candidatus Saccharimonadales bacterium]